MVSNQKMNKIFLYILISFLLLTVLLSSCAEYKNIEILSNLISGTTEEPLPTPTQEEVIFPTSTLTQPEPATPTSQPTDTLVPTPTITLEIPPTLASSPTPVQPGCTNVAVVDRHLSINDGALLQPNTLYAKVWRLKNIGTCTWNTNYVLTFVSGDDSLAQPDIPLPNEVQPEQTVEVRVNFETPGQGSVISGNWMLKSDTGVIFGTGSLADQPITLSYSLPYDPNLPPSC
jgi:hypothetical protein